MFTSIFQLRSSTYLSALITVIKRQNLNSLLRKHKEELKLCRPALSILVEHFSDRDGDTPYLHDKAARYFLTLWAKVAGRLEAPVQVAYDPLLE